MKNYLFKVYLILTTCLGLLLGFIFTSCDYTGSNVADALSSLRSEIADDRDDEDDDDDDDDDDRRSRNRYCDDRDSCQDLCDDMFEESIGARSECYGLKNNDVETLQEVFDVIADSSITKRELESLDSDDFGFFLSIGSEGDAYVDIIKDDYSVMDARIVLEWIAQDEDIASELLSNDEDYEVFIELVNTFGNGSGLGNINITETSPVTRISWRNSSYEIRKSSQTTTINLDFDIRSFVFGLTGKHSSNSATGFGGRDDSFIEYASSQNDDAFELAHNAVSELCRQATDEEDIDEDEVKQCVLSVYCSHKVDFFRRFDRDPFFIDDERNTACEYQNIIDEDRIGRKYF